MRQLLILLGLSGALLLGGCGGGGGDDDDDDPMQPTTTQFSDFVEDVFEVPANGEPLDVNQVNLEFDEDEDAFDDLL